MNVPDTYKPISNFSNYAISPAGDVYRIRPAAKGRFAEMESPKRISPVCHPKGIKWYVQMTSDNGKRHRIDVNRLPTMVGC